MLQKQCDKISIHSWLLGSSLNPLQYFCMMQHHHTACTDY